MPDELEEAEVYTGTELRGAVLPAVVFLVVVAVVIVGLYFILGTGEGERPLEDIDMSGSITLDGAWRENLTAYGPHVVAINLTLAEGDEVELSFSSMGPPGGIQVRLQRPLHPESVGGSQVPTDVVASAASGNGSLEHIVVDPGAYQVYFWHPGSARDPSDGGYHFQASVSYHLVVHRAGRP
jgi:hypothetical protein